MREIKYRAWHKAEKRMFEVFYLSWFHGILLICDNDAAISPHYGSGEVELMQFTGRRDLHRKDCYEGDIVRAGKIISVVSWGRYDCQFQIEQMNFDRYILSCGNIDGWVIIGNIYENPELLEKLRSYD